MTVSATMVNKMPQNALTKQKNSVDHMMSEMTTQLSMLRMTCIFKTGS